MVEIGVRVAAPDDLPPITALEVEARRAAAGERGGGRLLADHPAVGSSWAAWIDAADRRLLVGTIDAVPIGYLALALPASPGGAGRVEQVYVTGGARELGVGEALIQAAVDELVAVGAGAIDAVALPGDRETKNLYERAGITARLIIVSRTLP